jgi:hypothetical protein
MESVVIELAWASRLEIDAGRGKHLAPCSSIVKGAAMKGPIEAWLVAIFTPGGYPLLFGGLVVSTVVSCLTREFWPRCIYMCVTAMLAVLLLSSALLLAFLQSGAPVHPSQSPVDLTTLLFFWFIVPPAAVGWILGWPLGALMKFAETTQSTKQ